MSESRTSKSVKNIAVSLLSYFAGVVLTLYSKKVFLDTLGADTLGLQSTIGGFLGTLSLAELGLGVAIGAAMYRHLEDRNHEAITEIISIQGWFYRRVAVFLVVCTGLFMLFSSELFKHESLPSWYIYATLASFLWSSIAGYLFNYRSAVLSVDQKGYKLAGVSQVVSVVKVVSQVAALSYLGKELGYICFLALEVISTAIGVLWLEHVIRKEYPWLKPCVREGWALRKKHPELLKHTGQIVVHSFAATALWNISPMLMFAYTTLTIIGNYNTYGTLTNSASLLIRATISSIRAGIGSLVAEGIPHKIIGFFWEQIALRQFIVTIATAGIIVFGHQVMDIWVGDKYRVSDAVLILMSAYFYLNNLRDTVDAYNVAYKLFHDIWASFSEGVVFILLACFLGAHWGLEGILVAAITSQVLFVHLWKPIFLFREGLHRPVREYWQGFVKFPIISILFIVVGKWLYGFFALEHYTIPELLGHSGAFAVVFSLTLGGVYFAVSQGFRKGLFRMLALVFRRFR